MHVGVFSWSGYKHYCPLSPKTHILSDMKWSLSAQLFTFNLAI